jgi:hypothetical protein
VSILGENMIFFKHPNMLTNFIVLILDRHLDFSFEKVYHVVWVSHLRHIFLLALQHAAAEKSLVETIIKNHPFVS